MREHTKNDLRVWRNPQQRSYTFNFTHFTYIESDETSRPLNMKMFSLERPISGVSNDMEAKWVEKGEFDAIEPSAYLTETEAQVLLDSLYSTGLRPSDGTDNTHVIAKMNDHLQDMRQLVFSKSKVEKPSV